MTGTDDDNDGFDYSYGQDRELDPTRHTDTDNDGLPDDIWQVEEDGSLSRDDDGQNLMGKRVQDTDDDNDGIDDGTKLNWLQ